MHAFILPQFEAECEGCHIVILDLKAGEIEYRDVNTNLELYSPEDEENPKDKIMNFVDCTIDEGYFNFYLARFSNNTCMLFSFGLNHGTPISISKYIGQYEINSDVMSNLHKTLNAIIENSVTEFRSLYNDKIVARISLLVKKITGEMASLKQ